MTDEELGRKGRRIALFLAGVAVFWIVLTELGRANGWSLRTRALFDLIALAGFGFSIWMTYGLWRDRRNDKG